MWKAAMCIRLSAKQQKALFAALTLSGIHIIDSTTPLSEVANEASMNAQIDRPGSGSQDDGPT